LFSADLTADGAQFLRLRHRHVDPVPDDLALGRFDEPVDAAQQGGLARTAQADDDQELSIADLKADVLEGHRPVVVDLGQVSYFQHRYSSIH